jgi:hypothetical protein
MAPAHLVTSGAPASRSPELPSRSQEPTPLSLSPLPVPHSKPSWGTGTSSPEHPRLHLDLMTRSRPEDSPGAGGPLVHTKKFAGTLWWPQSPPPCLAPPVLHSGAAAPVHPLEKPERCWTKSLGRKRLAPGPAGGEPPALGHGAVPGTLSDAVWPLSPGNHVGHQIGGLRATTALLPAIYQRGWTGLC